MSDNFNDIQAHLDGPSYNSMSVPRSSGGPSSSSTDRNNSFSNRSGFRIPISSPNNASASGTGTFPRHGIPIGHSTATNINNPAINSFGHFASSYTRAQSFLTIEPLTDATRARSYFVDEEEAAGQPSHLTDQSASFVSTTAPSFFTAPGSRRQSFSARFIDADAASFINNNYNNNNNNTAIEDEDVISEYSGLLPQKPSAYLASRRASYVVPPQHGTVLLQEGEAVAPGTESEPVIVRTFEDKNGNVSTEVAGQSTVPQTIFNSINVLIGVGLLSLPLGFKYSGWLVGSILLTFAASTTYYTAYLLAKCMDTDPTLVTYADIAYAAYGPRARLLTSLLFTLELMGMGVSLVILFADSLNALFPQISKDTYKYIAFVVLTPPCFLPLRILSVSSIMGIFSTLGLIVLVFFDGIYKTQAPGSLWQPEPTHILPTNWMAVPLAIGIFMAPWGGHAVFPNIYRDMRHPQKYEGALLTIYKIVFPIDTIMGILGYVMFGSKVENEVTKSILLTKGYAPHQDLVITSLVSLIPLAKTPLNARPIVSTIDILTGLDKYPLGFDGVAGMRDTLMRVAKISVRLLVVLSFVWMAIVFPDFDRIIAFFGATLCITICINGPVAFYLKIYGDKVPKWERYFNYFLLVVYAILAIFGTIWCFIPPERFQ
ncbi:uncharacterized protein SAPINGB_P002179 [Magnusiomyces paraingens]|uniref:Amino acid transporter transmembrane domain-containing protein n=1 Tax=Magnusiomyces paraingens TaxID=2606893 RepID=A0A5E8BDX5_9ASCO|nr:uncharacterized protein SAPINGB_P002179 [Saprochaete ingens]VVT49252.1 unnamed protein product [Saprochaete ingens]